MTLPISPRPGSALPRSRLESGLLPLFRFRRSPHGPVRPRMAGCPVQRSRAHPRASADLRALGEGVGACARRSVASTRRCVRRRAQRDARHLPDDPRRRAGPRFHPRRLVANARQARSVLRRAVVRSRRCDGRPAELRAVPGCRHRHHRVADGAGAGVDLSKRCALRRGPETTGRQSDAICRHSW